jgi:hypothetical protein
LIVTDLNPAMNGRPAWSQGPGRRHGRHILRGITAAAARERFRELLDRVDAANGEMRALFSDVQADRDPPDEVGMVPDSIQGDQAPDEAGRAHPAAPPTDRPLRLRLAVRPPSMVSFEHRSAKVASGDLRRGDVPAFMYGCA